MGNASAEAAAAAGGAAEDGPGAAAEASGVTTAMRRRRRAERRGWTGSSGGGRSIWGGATSQTCGLAHYYQDPTKILVQTGRQVALGVIFSFDCTMNARMKDIRPAW